MLLLAGNSFMRLFIVGFVVFRMYTAEEENSNEKVLRIVSNLATQIQKEKANLKESLQKDVTTEETMEYLEKLNIIDSEYNIISEELENLKLLPNGIITYNGEKKGQVLLTDYYDSKEVKTIWTQDNTVDNNLVTIQINDGKFLEIQEDNNFKVWKYI